MWIGHILRILNRRVVYPSAGAWYRPLILKRWSDPLIKLAIAFLLVSATVIAQEKTPELHHFDPKMVDLSVDPCDDFQQYACGKYFAENPIPADEVYWGVASQLSIWNETVLRKTLEEAAADKGTRSPNEQKIGDYYTACMNEAAIDTAGVKPLKPLLDRIDAMKSKSELGEVLAQQHLAFPAAWLGDDNATETALLGFGPQTDYNDARLVVAGLDQGGMGMPGRDFYLKDDEKSKQIRASYLTYISSVLVISGVPEADAHKQADSILALETEFAKLSMDNISRRDPKNLNNRFTLAQVKALTPSFQWDTYLSAISSPASPVYLVTTPNFFKGLEPLIQQTSLASWKAYLRWFLLFKSAPYLSANFVQARFEFRKALTGAQAIQPRWRRCSAFADRDLGEALGQVYVQRAFTAESKARVVQLVKDIEAALDQDIAASQWMQPATKEAAHAKLAAVLNKVGYPDQWRDYSALTITPNSLVENVERSTAFESRRQMNKIGKPLDRTEWFMTPPTVDAYEDPQTNTINFPAGILQPPFFDPAQPDSFNYGSEGAVIGHETIHGFDDQGRKFDLNGNLHDWWSDADTKAYDERGDCISDEYTQVIPDIGVKQNGKLTQGEDTADNGGLYLALMALEANLGRKGSTLDAKGDDGLTNLQRFFLGYANSWCEQVRPEAERTQVLTNPHSIPKYRVNNVVGNMPEFAKAFSCKAGKPMVHAKQCRVW
jgi:putative endopeptidase